VEDLRRQAEIVLAVSSCSCGCGSIGFAHPDGHRPPPRLPAHPASVQRTITNTAGEPIGGLILFLREGRLVELEVYSFTSEPLAMPETERIDWFRLDRT
jgi:hypothetical protein